MEVALAGRGAHGQGLGTDDMGQALRCMFVIREAAPAAVLIRFFQSTIVIAPTIMVMADVSESTWNVCNAREAF